MAKKFQEVKVSLLPGEAQRLERERSRRITVKLWIFIVAGALLIGVFGFYFKVRNGRVQNENSKRAERIANLSKEAKAQSAKLAVLENLGGEIGFGKTILKEHRAADNLLEVLEKTAIPEVMLTSLAADIQGSLVVGVGAKDNDAAARQVLAWFLSEDIQDVEIGGWVTKTDPLGNVEGVEFSATLILNAEVFNWNP